jgi:hypothetical protein
MFQCLTRANYNYYYTHVASISLHVERHYNRRPNGKELNRVQRESETRGGRGSNNRRARGERGGDGQVGAARGHGRREGGNHRRAASGRGGARRAPAGGAGRERREIGVRGIEHHGAGRRGGADGGVVLDGARDAGGDGGDEARVVGDGRDGLDPRRRRVGVHVVVAQVHRVHRVGLVGRADGVVLLAPVAQHAGVRVDARELAGRAGEEPVEAGAGAEVVRLVGGVAGVAEGDGRDDCGTLAAAHGGHASTTAPTTQLTPVARAGVPVQRGRAGLDAAVERDAAAAAEDVGHDLAALRVAGQDQLGVRAQLGVGRHLRDAGDGAVVGGLARQVGEEGRVDQVLVATAGQPVTGRRDERALAAWVGLVVPAGEEEVHVVAGGRRARIGGVGRGREGEREGGREAESGKHREASVGMYRTLYRTRS